MAVYVDNMEAQYGRMIMCHMIADTSEELHRMADRLGVARRWCQFAGTPREHYDIAKVKKALALRLGAIEITSRELATKIHERRLAAMSEKDREIEAWAKTKARETPFSFPELKHAYTVLDGIGASPTAIDTVVAACCQRGMNIRTYADHLVDTFQHRRAIFGE